ncbi:glutaredoxin family protein [Thalassotalea sp. 1_MG-2023]|uniref:glutaredoxin family protein n=1 Tax=Thalassotalea sp. 1_MG-2023 TaxID=3062680 RepID=UPI0026E39537|nr:glutaredoxin family protein [Thalassotalea sp. 1_MG-2023]MDO6428521.1 glutaredoxin family protein [Thalassotalea sp. 1_MG-2023]
MKKITLYTMKNCPHCKTAQQYLDKRNLPYRLCNVKTPSGQKELARLGYRAVPVLKIGDAILNGFSIKQFERMLKNE